MIGLGLRRSPYAISAKSDMFKLHNRKGINLIHLPDFITVRVYVGYIPTTA